MLIALDIGGTKLAAARIEGRQILERRQLPMAYDEAGFCRLLDEISSGWDRSLPLAVAVTGYVDDGLICSVNRDIIPFWNRFPLRQTLARYFTSDMVLINDAQAAAWGEYQERKIIRNGQHPADLLFMTLSTGVGGGVVLGHQLHTGTHGLAGHVGHVGARLPALDNVMQCGCGAHGCLELLASGTALARQASHLFGCPVTCPELFAMASGYPVAEHLIAYAAQAVAEAIAGFHMSIDIQEVVIGGSVGMADRMLERIRIALAAMTLPAAPVISGALLGADAGLLGVAAWMQR